MRPRSKAQCRLIFLTLYSRLIFAPWTFGPWTLDLDFGLLLEPDYSRRTITPDISIQRVARVYHQWREPANSLVIDVGMISNYDDAVCRLQFFVVEGRGS